MAAKDDAVNRFHDVERRAEHGVIVAIEKHFGRRRVGRVELRKYAKLAAHIMSGLNLASEGRAPKNKFLSAQMQRVREVGMSTGKLANLQSVRFAGEMEAQIGCEFG